MGICCNRIAADYKGLQPEGEDGVPRRVLGTAGGAAFALPQLARGVLPKVRRRAEEHAPPAPTKGHSKDGDTRSIAAEIYAKAGL